MADPDLQDRHRRGGGAQLRRVGVPQRGAARRARLGPRPALHQRLLDGPAHGAGRLARLRLAASSQDHQQGRTRQRRHRRRPALLRRRACRRLAGPRASGGVCDQRLGVAPRIKKHALLRRPRSAPPPPAFAATLIGGVTDELRALLQARQDRRKAELDASRRDVQFDVGAEVLVTLLRRRSLQRFPLGASLAGPGGGSGPGPSVPAPQVWVWSARVARHGVTWPASSPGHEPGCCDQRTIAQNVRLIPVSAAFTVARPGALHLKLGTLFARRNEQDNKRYPCPVPRAPKATIRQRSNAKIQQPLCNLNNVARSCRRAGNRNAGPQPVTSPGGGCPGPGPDG